MSLSPEFIEQLETAALLPDEDPQRQAVLAAMGEHGAEARQYWLDLLRTDERLRLDLLSQPMPEGLNAKLLRIPNAPPVGAQPSRWRRMQSWAALILLTAALAYLAYPKIRDYRLERRQTAQLKELAVWAVENHISMPPDVVESDDPAVIGQAFAAAHMPIPTPIFPVAQGAKIIGGGTARMHDKPVVFTRYVSGDQHYTLFEFAPEQMGLALDFPGRTETPQKLWTGNKHYAVEIWSQENYRCGWLLVKESPDAPAPYKPIY